MQQLGFTGWPLRLAGRAVLGCLVSAALVGTASCRAQQSWPLWQAYTQRFLDEQGRIIDRSAGDRTTSEGEAYAMFFALVADDRAHFDKLLGWTESNLAGGDLTVHLPAWDWGRTGDGSWKVRDSNPAADADLWLAYTLIEAGRLWHEPRYETLGKTVAREIARQEVVLVDGVGTVLAPGPSGFHVDDHTAEPDAARSVNNVQDRWILNPSYTPPSLVARLSRAVPDGPWRSVQESLPALVGGAPSHGFAMDWVSAGAGEVHPSMPPQEAASGKREARPAGSYDAIRTYLWVGMSDGGTDNVPQLRQQLAGMTGYLRTASTPPLEVDQTGQVLHADAPPGFSAAVIPFLAAVGLRTQAKVQADRLEATRDTSSGLYGHGTEYYDQNLSLFSTGFSDGRFRFERDGRLHVRWK